MSLFTAILVGALASLLGFPFRNYFCWFSWSKGWALVGTVLYLFITGAGGGLIGWAAAQLAHAHPFDSLAASGVIYGAAGAVALRAETPRTSRRRGQPTGTLRDASSLLNGAVLWSAQLLDDSSRRSAERHFHAISDDDLLAAALYLQTHLGASPVSDKAKTATLGPLVDAMNDVRDAGKRAVGRARLERFCSDYVVAEHLPRAQL